MPGASYTPRLFMPTNRFSTMSIRPTPLRPAILFSSSTIASAVFGLPLSFTGTPCSNAIVTSSTLSGASCGETVMPKSTVAMPSTAGSSSLPAS